MNKNLWLEMSFKVSLTEPLRVAQPSICLSTVQLLSTQPLWEDRIVYLGVHTSNRQKKVICLALLEFLPEDRLGSWLFHEMGVCLFMTSYSTGFYRNLTTKLFPQPSKVLRLMMKMTTAGKVLLLMKPLQWESPCLPFSARSVSE